MEDLKRSADGLWPTGALTGWKLESRQDAYLVLFLEFAQSVEQINGTEPRHEIAVTLDPRDALVYAEELRQMALALIPDATPHGAKVQ